MEILNKLSAEIKSAMIGKNQNRLNALRLIKSQIDLLNSSGEEVTESKILVSLQKMVKQRKESADIYKSKDRQDLYEVEMSEIAVIEEFLPKQMTREEIEFEVAKIISNLGATSIKDIGKVMSVSSKEFVGRADSKLVSEIVKTILV